MRPRTPIKKIMSCTTEGELREFETSEERSKAIRRADFLKSNCKTADLYLFTVSIKKQIEKFKTKTQ